MESKDFKEEISENVSIKIKDMEDKYYEEINSLKLNINEIIKENEELKKEISDNISIKLKEIEDKNYEEINLLKLQINEIKSENNELKGQILQQNNKIQYGEYYITFFNSDYEYMFNSTDVRSFTHHINFDEKYETIPKVMISINFLDADKDVNLRINVYTENIDTHGFDFTIQTWDDSKIHTIKIAWISFIKN